MLMMMMNHCPIIQQPLAANTTSSSPSATAVYLQQLMESGGRLVSIIHMYTLYEQLFPLLGICIKEGIQMSPGQCAARANQLDSAGFLCISSSGTGSPACCGPPYGDLINIFKCTPNYAQLTDSLITESSASGYMYPSRETVLHSRD